jgi:hypothetical protein
VAPESEWFVVVDGKEKKKYERIREDSIVFGPDGTHMAFTAAVACGTCNADVNNPRGWNSSQRDSGPPKKEFVVMDEKEGQYYDDIVSIDGKIIFDSPDSVHYLARKGSDIYLVEEKMK